jgi:hypothetical protein
MEGPCKTSVITTFKTMNDPPVYYMTTTKTKTQFAPSPGSAITTGIEKDEQVNGGQKECTGGLNS